MSDTEEQVSVRYMVNNVAEAVAFYTKFLNFRVLHQFPAFADVARGKLRLLLSGPMSSAGRPMQDGVKPAPGGWNRIHLIVDDIDSEVARLWNLGVRFRNEIVDGPGGKQVLLEDPSGNVVELFQPAAQDVSSMRTDRHHVAQDLRRALGRSWTLVGAFIAMAVFGEAVFAGAMLSGVPWAQAAHALNAKILVATTVVLALLSLVRRRRIAGGTRLTWILLSLAALIGLQSAFGASSAHGANLLWIHIPLGVALFAFAAYTVKLLLTREPAN